MADITAGKAPPLKDTSPTPETTVPSSGPVRVTEGSSMGVGGPDNPETHADTFAGQVKKLVRRIKHGSKQKPKEKPESMPDDTYDFNHFRRGIAVLIVNTEFSNVGHDRPDAKQDIENLTALFKVLGFEIKLLKNKTSRDLMDSLTDIRSKLEKDSDCFACLISTHGEEARVKGYDNLREHVLETYDGLIPTDDIIRTFNDSNCAAMRGKPKLFFIQACRRRFNAADADVVDPGVDIDIITDSIQPPVTGPGGEGRYVSQHQGGSDSHDCASTPAQGLQKEQGNHGRSFDTTTAPDSLTAR